MGHSFRCSWWAHIVPFPLCPLVLGPQAFSCWAHLIAIRLFVESILRYGLPPAYQAAMVIPQDKQEQKLRKALADTFGAGKADLWSDAGNSAAIAGLAGEEMFPYVSLSMNIDLSSQS